MLVSQLRSSRNGGAAVGERFFSWNLTQTLGSRGSGDELQSDLAEESVNQKEMMLLSKFEWVLTFPSKQHLNGMW